MKMVIEVSDIANNQEFGKKLSSDSDLHLIDLDFDENKGLSYFENDPSICPYVGNCVGVRSEQNWNQYCNTENFAYERCDKFQAKNRRLV